jgi:glyoxylase-like metal-dependent hydrolase (beta-lactamase superfamily II)/rhodanese-related sulfurtransferase
MEYWRVPSGWLASGFGRVNVMGGKVQDILSVVDEGLGHSSHVVGLGDGTALVIDPARLPDRQRRLVAERGWRVAWSADTHSHADYISGGPELADDGAVFVAPARAGLAHPHRGVEPGEDIALADGLTLRAIPTPGHTSEHLAYLLMRDRDPVALFSGGSLMVGTVGRTDLLGDGHRGELAVQLFRALRDEILVLPDDLAVYPTHGAGSFCSAPTSADRATTIGRERTTNPLLQVTDEHEFVKRLLSGLGTFPTYFRLLPERNRQGVRHYRELPTLSSLTASAVAAHIERGAVLLDARPLAEFAAGHPKGALSNVLRPVFGSWLGWLVELDRPLVFVLGDGQDRAELVRQCLTIGHENLLGELDGGMRAWQAVGYPVEAIPLVDRVATAARVLDVRQDVEWASGHVPGARHIELGNLANEAVTPEPTTVMCGHGERAMTAASLLAARGHQQITVLAGGPADWATATDTELVTGP